MRVRACTPCLIHFPAPQGLQMPHTQPTTLPPTHPQQLQPHPPTLPAHTHTHTHTHRAAETGQHIFWSCEAWHNIRDSHSPNIEHLARQFPGPERTAHWPPCLLMCGLAPDMPLPVNRQERNTSLEFLQAIHAMYVAILAARKIRDEQAHMLFPSARHVRQTGYPYQQLIGLGSYPS